MDEISKRMQTTLEKDMIKKMTEAVIYKVFEEWWEKEETIFKQKEGAARGGKKEEREEKTTTECLLNSIIDYDCNYGGPSFGLGFRAALPKMPSFKVSIVELIHGTCSLP